MATEIWTDIGFGFVMYLFPLAVLPLVTRRNPGSVGVAILAMFGVPLVAAFTLIIAMGRFSFLGVLGVYPFMLFPLGFWAGLIAALATPALRYLAAYGRVILLISAVISGATIGTVFMLGFVRLMMRVDPPSYPVDGAMYVICGLTSGSIVAVVAALHIASSQAATPPPSNPPLEPTTRFGDR
jgi:hypothetical protein